MSRVLFVALGRDQIEAQCRAEGVGISALEDLPAGGMRLVCMSRDGAAVMNDRLRKKLIVGAVARTVHRPSTPLW